MSVQKYVISKNPGNFTIISNAVLQGLNNYEALGLYCYISSLPPGWSFHKEQLSSRCGIGRDKINKLLGILVNHELITIEQKRNTNGSFSHIDIHVNDGSSFKINELPLTETPLTDLPLTASQSLVNSTYKRNTNKPNNIKKEILSCSTEVERQPFKPTQGFDAFWHLYPRKENKKGAWKIWNNKKIEFYSIDIIEHLQKRLEGEWKTKDKQYIPMPTTFLNGERWNDDLTVKHEVKPIKHIDIQHKLMERAINAQIRERNQSQPTVSKLSILDGQLVF